ncbi:MAG: ATP-binding protein [Methanolinea sp.]|nr:ATP-binding protein [Methanolinea sp.]
MSQFFKDITDRVILEQEREKAEERLREAIHLARLGFWEWDIGKDKIWWSRELCEILGWDPDQPPPSYSDLSRIYTPVSWQKLFSAVERAVSSGEPYDLELEVIRPDGERLWTRATGGPVRDVDKTITGLHGTVQDITGTKRAENALKKANRQLNLLVSITRHDIRNSVTAAQGYLELMENADPGQPGLARERLGQILAQIARQIQATNECESLGEEEPSWQCIEGLLDGIEVPPSVSFVRDSCPVSVLADPVLRRVFDNLLDNSLRHGGPTMDRIHVSCVIDGDELVIAWEDNGCGIPFEEKERIFDSHYGRNTGLGLFLVRDILAITGMSIRETGEPGKGACFEIRVPAGMWQKKEDLSG